MAVLRSQRHRVDHGWALGTVHHDQLEEAAGGVGSENEVAGGVFCDLFHDDGTAQRMLDLLDVNSVPKCRQENVHLGIVVQNYLDSQQEPASPASTGAPYANGHDKGTHLHSRVRRPPRRPEAEPIAIHQPDTRRRPSSPRGRTTPHAGRGRGPLPGEHEDRPARDQVWLAPRGSPRHSRRVPG